VYEDEFELQKDLLIATKASCCFLKGWDVKSATFAILQNDFYQNNIAGKISISRRLKSKVDL
jgi:hypothetical protein